MLREIEQQLEVNSHSVGQIDAPQIKKQIKSIAKKTAESLLECAIDNKVKETLKEFLPSASYKILTNVLNTHKSQNQTVAEQIYQGLMKVGTEATDQLFRDIQNLHSFSVCKVIETVDEVASDTELARNTIIKQLFKLEKVNQAQREADKAEFAKMVSDKEKTIDAKRELEFDLMQMGDRNDRAIARGQKAISEIQQKVNKIKDAQDQTKYESKLPLIADNFCS